jgi:hypothetical protein
VTAADSKGNVVRAAVHADVGAGVPERVGQTLAAITLPLCSKTISIRHPELGTRAIRIRLKEKTVQRHAMRFDTALSAMAGGATSTVQELDREAGTARKALLARRSPGASANIQDGYSDGLLVAGLVTSLAGLGGIGTGLYFNQKTQFYVEDVAQRDHQEASTWARRRNIAYSAGAVFTATGVGLAVWGLAVRPDDDQRAASVILLPSAGGLLAMGQF